MTSGGFRYLFGPVASRRFGRSLGIDLLGQRVCSFNCIFCEAGPTQTCTLQRDAYVPLGVVLGEFRAWLGAGGTADVVTLAGRGEPTLHTGFGAVIDAIHGMCEIPVVLLSNGSLMWMPEVRRDAARADIVKISLSGWDGASLETLNQPALGLRFEEYLAGLRAFRRDFTGALRLEVMFVAGVNDTEDAARRIAAHAALLAADRVELNTVVRPPADRRSGPVPADVLLRYAAYFGPRAVVIGPLAECASADAAQSSEDQGGLTAQILALLGRRGCTLDELATGIGRREADIQAGLQELIDLGRVRPSEDREAYYQLVRE